MQSLQDAKQQFLALGQETYEIGMINQATGKHMSDPRTIITLEKKFDRYLEKNSNGENIYIRAPQDEPHSLLMLDDLNEAGLNFISEKFAHPACIVETSECNFQCWYRLPQRFEREDRKNMERVFVEALHKQGLPVDKKSADGGHYGRLAGFINCKPSRNGFCVKLVNADGHILTDDNVEYLLDAAQQLAITDTEAKITILNANIHDIKSHIYTNSKILKDIVWIAESLRPTNSPSETDWYIACRLAKKGYTENDISKALLEFSPNDISRKHDPAYYLNLTASNAVKKYPPATSPQPTPKEPPTPPKQVGACCSCACSPSTAGTAGGGHHQPAKPRPKIAGVKPRNRDQDRAAADRERERDHASAQRDRERDRQRM